MIDDNGTEKALAKEKKREKARSMLYPILLEAYYKARKSHSLLRMTKKTHTLVENFVSEGLNTKALQRALEVGYEKEFDPDPYYVSPIHEATLDAVEQGKFHEALTSGPVDWTKCPVRLHWDFECGTEGVEATFHLTQREIVKLQKRRFAWLAGHDCHLGFVHLSNGKEDPSELLHNHPSPGVWNGRAAIITTYSRALCKAKLVRKLSGWLKAQGVRVQTISAVH